MPYGHWGKALRVNLTTGEFRVEPLDEVFLRRYIGGWGFVAYYLLKELRPGIDPRHGPTHRGRGAPCHRGQVTPHGRVRRLGGRRVLWRGTQTGRLGYPPLRRNLSGTGLPVYPR
ncbi:MAG: hypothetical protein H5T70_05425 [Chloroflexi bacterium]|nr:hypothetical protein [Chloroflexota bacterium]